MDQRVKILTVCRQGLVRSVALADVLKLHFEPVDVLPVGWVANAGSTMDMLLKWSDHVIAMHQPYYDGLKEAIYELDKEVQPKLHLCEVGRDTYKNSKHRVLIDAVWNWARLKQNYLGIKEHFELV